MITNIHTRKIAASLSVMGDILDSLSSKQDLLWPYEKWPPMHLDKPLGLGANGGHDPGRYFVEAYEPGRYIRFRFTAPKGFIGTHCFSINEITPGIVQIEHKITMKLEGLSRVSWPLIIRWMHDALIEDAFDKVETFVTSHQVNHSWSLWVRFLRYIRH